MLTLLSFRGLVGAPHLLGGLAEYLSTQGNDSPGRTWPRNLTSDASRTGRTERQWEQGKRERGEGVPTTLRHTCDSGALEQTFGDTNMHAGCVSGCQVAESTCGWPHGRSAVRTRRPFHVGVGGIVRAPWAEQWLPWWMPPRPVWAPVLTLLRRNMRLSMKQTSRGEGSIQFFKIFFFKKSEVL